MQRTKIKNALIVAGYAVMGGLISRWHGGGFFGGAKIFKNILWGIPFGGACFFITGSWIWAGIALVLCAAGKATGHGRGMSLLNPVSGDPERLEFLIAWLYGRVSDYWYQVAILSLTGLAAVLGGVIATSTQSPLCALILGAGGTLKGAAYMIGWKIYPQGTGAGADEFNEATEIGEFLTGFFAYLALAIALVVCMA